MDKLIIEVRVNEYAPRSGNPNIPYTADELGRAARLARDAGAAIVHFHPRTASGAPAHAVNDYVEAVRAIRAETDLVLNPTLGQITVGGGPGERLAPIEALAACEGLKPELCGIDPGSTNIDIYDEVSRRFAGGDRVYVNSHNTLVALAGRLRELGIKPALACWSIPFVRSACALIDMGLIEDPPYFFFVCGEGGMLGAHPASPEGLRAFTDHLPRDRKPIWSVGCKNGNLLPLAFSAIAAGGHVAIGIGDYPYPELGAPTNARLVEEVARLARLVGRGVASPDEARQALGLAAPTPSLG
jgi:3-keto-5-aminohexanoate cleavage enzyme